MCPKSVLASQGEIRLEQPFGTQKKISRLERKRVKAEISRTGEAGSIFIWGEEGVVIHVRARSHRRRESQDIARSSVAKW